VIGVAIGRKFARLATNAAVRNPRVWRFFRPLVRRQFDSLAPVWDSMLMEDSLASYEAGLEALAAAPARALDLGTGTGAGARAIARRFPEVEVVGVDLSDEMLGEAHRRLPEELRGRITFQQADGSALPFADGSFQLVAHANMIPFFDELARVLAPGGYALFAFSSGATTPIYVAPEKLKAELSRRGFSDFAGLAAGRGNGLLARKDDRP
jgi:ubiquinone/menaquinone biosynthesis C-methylase UbiE